MPNKPSMFPGLVRPNPCAAGMLLQSGCQDISGAGEWRWSLLLTDLGHSFYLECVYYGFRFTEKYKRFNFFWEMILDRIRITLWNCLPRLLKCFRFSENVKEVNQNQLKHLFYCFTITVKKLKTFKTDSPLKHFNFSPFETAPNKRLNQKRFWLWTLLCCRSGLAWTTLHTVVAFVWLDPCFSQTGVGAAVRLNKHFMFQRMPLLYRTAISTTNYGTGFG
jgi:hypothetical protein